jgi:hypothetical protein
VNNRGRAWTDDHRIVLEPACDVYGSNPTQKWSVVATVLWNITPRGDDGRSLILPYRERQRSGSSRAKMKYEIESNLMTGFTDPAQA